MYKVDPGSKPEQHTGLSTSASAQDEPPLGRLTFSPKTSLSQNNIRGAAKWIAAEGYEKLKARLISHALPETVVTELIEHHTPINYPKGSMIFLQGAPTDLIYWVSSGLVDILCPEPEGSQIQTSLLGPGDIFGFVEASDSNGKQGQAFQARARTNVQLGLVTRDRVLKVLSRLDPPLLVRLLEEITAMWGSFTHYQARYLGMNFSERMETLLDDLARKFGVKDSRGTLLIPELGHADFAEMIGSSRPMVSRLIAEMIANRRLSYDGKHYIVVDHSANDGRELKSGSLANSNEFAT
jgi:CRP/FNR family transcriptional regulator, cyclic AMP receptor protein